jgi:WD40 repeat protein
MLPPLRGHDDWIRSVKFSPDGSKIVSGSDDKTIRVWDASTGFEILPPLQGHHHAVKSVEFSPDGSKIVSGSNDKTIRVWDASTGLEMLPPLRGHDDWIHSVKFSPDGSKIVSGSDDKTVRVWNASTGLEMLAPLQGHDDWIRSIKFSPDGSNIISQSYHSICVWDANTGVQLLTTPSPQNEVDFVSGSAQDHLTVSFEQGWFTNINTGHIMGRLPVGVFHYGWRVHRSTYVGWTRDSHKLVILQFPVE